ncbi:hypothetical protein RCH10_005354 [Variovorax sp. GrIS 2.14]
MPCGDEGPRCDLPLERRLGGLRGEGRFAGLQLDRLTARNLLHSGGGGHADFPRMAQRKTRYPREQLEVALGHPPGNQTE